MSNSSHHNAIVLDHLTKYYVQNSQIPPAVNDITLSIKSGEVVGLLGLNGAGKTTTIKMMCGLVTPSAGNVYLNGFHVINQRRQAMQQIGVVLEGARNTYWQLTPYQNVMYFARLKGAGTTHLHQYAQTILHMLGLDTKQHQPVSDLSRGYQQKVAIACALICNPPIILLDEPTLGLDVIAGRAIKHVIKNLVEKDKKTIVITTHQLDLAEQLCNRIVIVHQGRIIVDQPTHQLLSLFKPYQYQFKIAEYISPEEYHQWPDTIITHNEYYSVLTRNTRDAQEMYTFIEYIKNKGLSLISATPIALKLEDIFFRLTTDQERI